MVRFSLIITSLAPPNSIEIDNVPQGRARHRGVVDYHDVTSMQAGLTSHHDYVSRRFHGDIGGLHYPNETHKHHLKGNRANDHCKIHLTVHPNG